MSEQCICSGPMSLKAFFIILFIILILISVIIMLSLTLSKDWNCPVKSTTKEKKEEDKDN